MAWGHFNYSFEMHIKIPVGILRYFYIEFSNRNNKIEMGNNVQHWTTHFIL